MKMLTSCMISLAIIAVSCAVLMPRITRPQQGIVILNESVYLNEQNTEVQYTFNVNKGDQLNIQISGNGMMVDYVVAPQGSSETVLSGSMNPSYNVQWTVPNSGQYVFTLYEDETTTVNILVTKA